MADDEGCAPSYDELQPAGRVGTARKRSARGLAESRGFSMTVPANWKPDENLFLPRLRPVEALNTPRGGYISPQWSTTSLPAMKPTARNQKAGGLPKRVLRESSTVSARSCPPSVIDIMKDAAPKTPPYLVGSTKFPKAYMEGGFVITPRGFEKTPAGLEPPFYAQSGPSVLQKGVIIKNKGSGIKWNDLEFYDIAKAAQSCSDDSLAKLSERPAFPVGRQQVNLAPQLLNDASDGLVRVVARSRAADAANDTNEGDSAVREHGSESGGDADLRQERVYSMQVFEIVTDSTRLKLLKELHTLLRCRDKAIVELEDALLLPPQEHPDASSGSAATNTKLASTAPLLGSHAPSPGTTLSRKRRGLVQDYRHGPGPYVALIKEPFLGTLREVCNGRALPSALVSVLVRQVVEGLRFLHSQLLVQHNDLTTNTAVLMPSGVVKLTSLGLCCAARDNAPERLLRLECSLFSDVWSLGLVTLELLTGRHVLASPPPPPQANADDLEEGDDWRAEGAASATPTPSTSNNMTPKARREEESPLRSLAAKATNALTNEPSLLDQTGNSAEPARMMEAEQEGIAQRLVAMNLPMGLIKASGYTATGASRPAALPPPCNSATLFLTDCLQKMPHLRRHCAVLLESKFISDCKDLAPSVTLDWIRDPSIELIAADRSESSHPHEGESSGAVADDAATAAYTSEEAGGGKALSAAKVRRKKGEALVHQVQQVVKHCLVTEEETRFLRNVFNFIDKDGDGSLDRDEILQILDFLGERKSALKDKEAVDHFMARLKLDGKDAGLTFEDFMQWWTAMDYWNMIGIQKESKETAMLRHSFNQYDDDGSGFIDIDELQNLLKDLGHSYTEDELRRMTRLICDDDDAEGLNFEQFTSLTLRLPYWKKIGVKGTKHFSF